MFHGLRLPLCDLWWESGSTWIFLFQSDGHNNMKLGLFTNMVAFVGKPLLWIPYGNWFTAITSYVLLHLDIRGTYLLLCLNIMLFTRLQLTPIVNNHFQVMWLILEPLCILHAFVLVVLGTCQHLPSFFLNLVLVWLCIAMLVIVIARFL